MPEKIDLEKHQIDEYDEKRIRINYDNETVEKIIEAYGQEISEYYIDQLYAIKEATKKHRKKYHRTEMERLFYKPVERRPYLYRPALKRYVNEFKYNFLKIMHDFEINGEVISIKKLVMLAEKSIEHLIPKGFTAGVSVHKIVTFLRQNGLFYYTNLNDINGYVKITEKGLNYIDHSEKHKKVLNLK